MATSPQIEDAEIYLPAIKQHLNPALYCFGAEFFQSHAGLTMFDEIVAASVRWSHLPFDTVIFIWQFASIALLLIGGWRLNRTCFGTEPACWGGVALLAAMLTVPISGTALLLFDQYLTPRSISAFTTVFAIGAVLDRRHGAAALWIAATALFHPLMALFTLCFVLLLVVFVRVTPIAPAVLAGLVAPLSVGPSSDAYHEVVLTRSYFFVLKWTWYRLGRSRGDRRTPLVVPADSDPPASRSPRAALPDAAGVDRAVFQWGVAAHGAGAIRNAGTLPADARSSPRVHRRDPGRRRVPR